MTLSLTFNLLLLGFFMGMRHATEADHLAAIATLAGRTQSLRNTALQGAAWGAGHTITLFLFAGIALSIGGIISDNYARLLESLVGIMLVGLGIDVLRRLYQQHVHFHPHRHDNDVVHFHAHAHAPNTAHDPEHHHHTHPKSLPRRALLIGLMHGMAGSAALVVLTAQTTQTISTGLLYVLLFGFGSILGMAALSVVIMLPLRRLQTMGQTRIYNALQLLIGILTFSIGSLILWENQALIMS